MSSELPPLVLHLDVDAFFVQAEQLRNPDLQVSG
jgi:nucleotidyltransferase/DNA polymerase involved in DNA repair